MTIVIPLHRALTYRVAARSFSIIARSSGTRALTRVDPKWSSKNASYLGLKAYYGCVPRVVTRSYATGASEKPVGRPKAHTGREPAKRTRKTPTATKSKATKPGPKKSAGRSKVGRKTGPQRAVSKTKPKPKLKPKKIKKEPSKTALAKRKTLATKDLKVKALLDSPKKLPESSWLIVFSEGRTPGTGLAMNRHATKEAAERFKNLTSEEKEHYNHLAQENKKKNDTAYKEWLSSYTPEQIREANNARRTLQRQDAAARPDRKHKSQRYTPIKDDRLVQRPLTAYIAFTKKRWASGDFSKINIAEAARLIAREWKQLSDAEKKPYQDEQEKSRAQYIEEYTSVYGSPPNLNRKIDS